MSADHSNMATPDGRISSDEIRTLAATVTGPVLVPGDDGYETECTGYNLAVPQRPAVVVGATGVRDVQAAIQFAARRAMPVAVLSTGHGSMVPSDGAALINTGRMDALTIDAQARSARVEAGVRAQQLVEAAAEVGLAPLTGSAPSVGVVGHSLGGGFGPLSRRYGFASDRVLSVDLVTADGQLRHVTAEGEPELFWALRGGKGNFGVVTSVEVELVPVTRLYGGAMFFAGGRVADVLSAWSEWTGDLPEEMTSSVGLLRAPPLPEFPETLRGKLVAHVRFAYSGSAPDGQRLIEPLRALGPEIIDTVAEMPFTKVYSIYNEPTDPLPLQDRSVLLRELPAGAVDVLVQLGGPAADCPLLLIELLHLGGALARPSAHLSAVSNRDAGFALHALGVGGPDQASAITSYAEELIRRLGPWSTGKQNVNYLTTVDATPEGVRRAYDADTYRRLITVKRTYDVDNAFRVNFNIDPA